MATRCAWRLLVRPSTAAASCHAGLWQAQASLVDRDNGSNQPGSQPALLRTISAAAVATPPSLKSRCFSTAGEEALGATSRDEREDARKEESSDGVKARLLSAAMNHVKAHGWTQAAIVAGAKDIGLSPAIGGVLERGESELVEYHIERQNEDFVGKLQGMAEELHGMRMQQKMFTAVKMRLEMNIPHIDAWPQALGVLAQPHNAPHALTLLTNLVDDIWYALGDKSVDMNWYTKRGLLAGVYVSTELYMLTDSSPDFYDTWEALQRRLDDVHAAGGAARELSRRLEQMFSNAGHSSQGASKPHTDGEPKAPSSTQSTNEPHKAT